MIAVEDCEVNRRSEKSVWPRVLGIVESIHDPPVDSKALTRKLAAFFRSELVRVTESLMISQLSINFIKHKLTFFRSKVISRKY